MEPLAANGELENWDALRARKSFPDLLLGNGASLAVWRNFAYFSLFDEAQTTRNRPLSPTELSVFRAMDTNIFEQALGALRNSIRVNAALTINASSPRHRYFAIKEALIHAIRSVHIPWSQMPADTLASINQELSRYRTVYNGNYDLLTYWAELHAPGGFDNIFRGSDATFEPTYTARKGNTTRILYLHGGLHLVKNADGSTRLLNSSESTLLASFAINQLGDIPLFVNESSSEDKLKSIRGSDYLSYCLGQLAQPTEGLCIFGHSLSKQDHHLLHAVQQASPKALAISIYPHNSNFIEQQKSYYQQLFAEHPHIELCFFNSMSHPLGNPGLRVPVPKSDLGATH
ncbi:DUF4917 family protein [Pseudomonas sp. TTU2014-080ASC]|uniref:DUF4917 family protein n=1 Tax=Pseudomonas sp. TTU2014-080ASC TaxID=1729724 RepID=UPI0007185F20|nr:DUF4917 family protein [Pseudomonas sp. TTU2014-080ASC]KRW58588.1 hypothetical protein AO726_17270 [Pseudomonas sp. TTU2014-080ASC]